MIYCDDICICIPVYKPFLTIDEEISLKRCNNVLNHYDKFFIAPENLELSSQNINGISYERFDNKYFQSTKTYSQLCVSHLLYERFIKYKYMLIYQLDAFVFRDDLLVFANCGFDYIGAPWCHLCKSCKDNIRTSRYVGNGGLSLRRIQKFIDVTKNINESDLDENEDLFFNRSNLIIPSCDIAMKFSVESNAVNLINMNNGQLPFGFHNLGKINRPFYKFLIENMLNEIMTVKVKI